MRLLNGKRRLDGGYDPPLLHRLLAPAVSGNAVNGLGERAARAPAPIYHHEGLPLAHRWLQRSFYLKILANPAYWPRFREVRRLQRTPHAPIAAQAAQAAPQEWSTRVREYALANGADVVGIARMRPEWVFDGYTVDAPWIVVIGVKMRHELLMRIADRGVDTEAGAHIIDIYNHGSRTARRVADWIRGQGWHAVGACGPLAGAVNLIPAALAAGLGELGKHGSVINDRLGSNFRLAYVLTELPLAADEPRRFGADEFCVNCTLCAKHCPPDAIGNVKQLVRGVEKWYVDFDRCVPYFNDSQGCGICLAVCPWSRPGVAPKLAEKMARRIAGIASSAHPTGTRGGASEG